MRIGIISDTHGNVAAWNKAVRDRFHGAELIIHAGDVLYHGPRNPIITGYDPAALAEEINRCPLPVLLVRGNCDADVDQMVLQPPLVAPCVLYQAGGHRLLAHHGHLWDPRTETAMARHYGLSLCISGHTHIPKIDKVGGTLFLNPGSASLPLGTGKVPSVGLWEDGLVRVIAVQTGEIIFEEHV